MKPALLKSLESPVQSFVVRELSEPHFDPNWHFHPQYQLFTVLEGSGTRFIGDDIRPFAPGDTVFMAPNLPHLWRSDRAYFEPDSGLVTRGIVVYFPVDFLGTEFFEKAEMTALRRLFAEAQRGLELPAEAQFDVQHGMKNLLRASGFDAVLRLLHLLHGLAQRSDLRPIASVGYANTHKTSETGRMQRVHEYVMNHFQSELRLDEVASLAGLSPAAFCRYFKARNNKTFSGFVSEIRIGHACKLLRENGLPVSQVAYESGFNTLSNFNRQFKEVTGKTPVQYQRA
ncbi:MAG: AraC family transcriptional regulator [Sphingobacteriaceae bacterium]|nr:AraC family transcriptional regulator [Cytophagaceae bacterium]